MAEPVTTLLASAEALALSRATMKARDGVTAGLDLVSSESHFVFFRAFPP